MTDTTAEEVRKIRHLLLAVIGVCVLGCMGLFFKTLYDESRSYQRELDSITDESSQRLENVRRGLAP